MDPARIRNIGVAAHIDAGKTTVSERILFATGVQHRFGNVDDGDTALDWMAEERARGITITAAATSVPWRDHWLNLIDTPGHIDFTIEVERSMRVLDGAILVLDGVTGVQVQSEAVWRQMQRHRVPGLAFVNKLDRSGADFLRVAADLRGKLRARAFPIQYPLFVDSSGPSGRELAGLVDLLSLRTWRFDPDGAAAAAEERQIPSSVADEVGVLRAELLEELAGEDEALFELVAAGADVPLPLARAALRARVIRGSLLPVLCGAALRNFGIHPLLDAVVDLLPSPEDLPPVAGHHPATGAVVERPRKADAPTCALAFKLQLTPHGDLTFARVYSGSIAPGTALWNPRLGRHERIARVLRIHASTGQALERADAGDIVALVGPKHTATGDTLCEREDPIVLESLSVPEPVLTLWIEPKSSADRERLHESLLRLAHEDPSFHVAEERETGRWLASGMGELHLEIIQNRLEREFRVRCTVGAPRVAYREAVRATGRGTARVERVLGGKEAFGAVEVEVSRDPRVERTSVGWDPGCPIPAAFRGAVTEAVELEARNGPLAGFPVVQLHIRIVGGDSDKARDHEGAFGEAAARSVRQALADARVDLLEPWMHFEVIAPAAFAGGITQDLNARGAEIERVDTNGGLRTLAGSVALGRMFGYATAVRSLSQGHAEFSLTPAELRTVPPDQLAGRGFGPPPA
jgi:elongation factor G